MSYVDLKHLLADLALEAVRDPTGAPWAAVALACAELASPAQPRFAWRDVLKRARTLDTPFGWKPTRQDMARLVKAGLFTSRGDFVALSPRFVPYLPYLKRQMARLLEAIAELHGNPRAAATDAVHVGTVLFNAGLFFECHEWFEGLWKNTASKAREFFHGLVQVAAAFYHYEKRNLHGSRTLLGKALPRLASYPDVYLGIDLAGLRADLAPWAKHFEGGPRPEDFPRIAAVK